ncbi:hypothetical protein OfM1_07260 [Lactovum odontotermitis]
MKKQTGLRSFAAKALIAGILLASTGQAAASAASADLTAAPASSIQGTENTAPKLEKLASAPFTLGEVQITNDGNGNLVAAKYTDAGFSAVSPFFQFSNLPQSANLSARVTIKNGSGKFVSRVPIQQNRFESSFYELKTETQLSNPGKKHTSVSYEIYLGKSTIGTFTINFAPAAEKPENFTPAQQESKLSTVQNVRIENGTLAWDAVDGAERYQITAIQHNAEGKAVAVYKAESDNLSGRRESLADLKSVLELPAGNYSFYVKASKLHNTYWNATLASDASTHTAIVSVD